jgi:hypothetical protein
MALYFVKRGNRSMGVQITVTATQVMVLLLQLHL